MPLVATRGAASAQGFGEFAQSAAPVYIEDVMSVYLYTSTAAEQTINNGIDLSGKGGLVWMKRRDSSVQGSHWLTDTVRGQSAGQLRTDTTNAQSQFGYLLSFDATGFTDGGQYPSNATIASWTFREQAKFFDVVTYTGDGVAGRTVSHNLGAVPGCMIVRRYDGVEDWRVYHRSLGGTKFMTLNTTGAAGTASTLWNDTDPTSSVFSLGTDNSVNGNGFLYVAYLFAHDAGGFGLTGADNVISCGSFTGNTTVNLGYEPQWVLIKASSTTGNWQIIDNMRKWVGTDAASSSAEGGAFLAPNLSQAESNTAYNTNITPTGFKVDGISGTYIYIAIRRGPMKTPTSGTSVFGANARTGTGANATVTGGQVDDAVLVKNRGSAVASLFSSRLTGTGYLVTSSTAAEVAAGTTILQANPWDVMDGVKVGTTSTITNASSNTFINYLFRRAPGFFDVVCYTGTNANRTLNHNLGVIPELIFVKDRSQAQDWEVYSATEGATKALRLNQNAASFTASTYWNNTTPTSSVFTVGTSSDVNSNGNNFVAYLFASCPGVSKVGSYTGTGTTLQIDCGFTAGARFVMIRRTSTGGGDWYVWDSARGIVSGNDPYLLLNSTAAEVTNTDYVDTLNAGFEISSTAPAAINASGGTFIFLAIA